jgi:hypothetical protein
MIKRFDFVADSSHGWLKVPMSEIERLGIADQISTFSYQKNGMAYLEEDCDMTVFMKAREARGEAVKIVEHHRNGRSRIRNYAMFGGDRMVTRVNIMSGAEFQERADTPYYCSPSSETYWSS